MPGFSFSRARQWARADRFVCSRSRQGLLRSASLPFNVLSTSMRDSPGVRLVGVRCRVLGDEREGEYVRVVCECRW